MTKEITLGVANANISYRDKETIIHDVEKACESLLTALGIGFENDPNTKETPKRMAKMYVNELFAGKYDEMPCVKDFPNQQAFDQLYTVGPIKITSMCSHHFLPFTGECYIAILPSAEGNVLGLSKFARIARWIFARPQIQEEATIMLADELEKLCQPLGLGIVVRAEHQCMTLRGVQNPDAKMTTSVMRGLLRENPALREEFLSLIKVGK